MNRRLASAPLKKFEFVERDPEQPVDEEPGFEEFLRDPSLSGDMTEEELEFLRKLGTSMPASTAARILGRN